MSEKLVINCGSLSVRVALLQNDVPVELFIERCEAQGVVGNVYRGRVARVLPGMQAAFVELGLARTGFLYVNDAVPRMVNHGHSNNERGDSKAASGREPAPVNIKDVLKQGQEILVQVTKDPLGQKGARLTRHISIPGRHLVLLPNSDHIGVSLRISSEKERERLRSVLDEWRAGCDDCDDIGLIARTVSEGVSAAELEREATMLRRLWATIASRAEGGKTPRLVFSDLDVVLRCVRDLLHEDTEGIYIDNEDDAQRVREFVDAYEPAAAGCVEVHRGHTPIFDRFGIEGAIDRALGRKVWLKSGGYIIIDQAEALTVVDVNSGSYVGKSSLEDTVTRTNLEAVREVAYQLRLRNIGGIVIIDFVDMAIEENRDKVQSALHEALAKDRAPTSVVRFSELGLVEMTRKRVRENLRNILTEPCPYCDAVGTVKSVHTMVNEVLRAIDRRLCLREGSSTVVEGAGSERPTILINMNSDVADFLFEEHIDEIEMRERAGNVSIIPVSREGFHRELFEIV